MVRRACNEKGMFPPGRTGTHVAFPLRCWGEEPIEWQHRRPSLSRAAWDYSLWILSDIVYSTYRTYRKRTGSGIWMRHITWSNRPIEYSFWPMTLCHQCTSLSQFLTRKIHIFFPCHLMSSYQVSILVPGPIDFNDVRLCQSVSHAF